MLRWFKSTWFYFEPVDGDKVSEIYSLKYIIVSGWYFTRTIVFTIYNYGYLAVILLFPIMIKKNLNETTVCNIFSNMKNGLYKLETHRFVYLNTVWVMCFSKWTQRNWKSFGI